MSSVSRSAARPSARSAARARRRVSSPLIGVSRPTNRRTCSASKAEARPRGRRGPRPEQLDVDAARDHRHPRRIGPHVPDEARALDQVRCDDPVGGAGDPDLGRQTLGGLGILRISGDGVLDRAERVEHVDQRRLPAAREVHPGQAREPVVAVDEVVTRALPGAERLDARREGGQVPGHRGPRDGPGRAGGDVDDPRARPEPHDLGDRRVLAPREDVDAETQAAERARHLAHVHVHPARLLAAERGEGARVDRENGDARRGRHGGRGERRHGRSRVTRRTSVGTAPKPYLYGSSPRRKS